MLPCLRTPVPGPRSRALARRLRAVESRNVTWVGPGWPVFWARAAGANVWDVDGNRYLDLTAAFGVASVGHTNPRVVAAVRRQAGLLLHAMGDVHPNELKLRLAAELSRLTFGRWRPRGEPTAKVVFAGGGAEAVEIALKTALLHTGRARVLAFDGSYHGLTGGALAATGRAEFRQPFARQLGDFVTHLPYGFVPSSTRRRPGGATVVHSLASAGSRRAAATYGLPHPVGDYGAVLVEPIQGRGGIVVPPDDFLPGLRRFCDRHGLVLIFDEVYTGFGRTGKWFAGEHWGVVPDLVCVGKALGAGVPLAACIGRTAVMDAWPASTGEALHTSTFLGHPLACAAALASLAELKRLDACRRAAELGQYLRTALADMGVVRGRGLMLGLEVPDAVALARRLLRRGILALPEGPAGSVLGITPPLTITPVQLEHCARVLREMLVG